MVLKNKEINKLFDAVELYYDMVSLPSVMTSFMACDDAIEGEIAALKAELTDANQRLNNERKHGEDLADVNGQLASENVDLKARLTLFEHSRITWRARAQHAEKEVTDLNKKIHELEEENANLRETPFDTLEALKKENSDLKTRNEALSATCENSMRAVSEAIEEVEQYKKNNLRVTPDDAIRVKSLERANKILRRENGTLWRTLEKRDIGERTCYKSLSETIEFQNKKIEELEADINTLKKKIHELKIRNENLEKSNGILRGDNETLFARLEERERDISKRPWHGDVNAMIDERTCHKSLVETIEELKAKKARLEENVDLSYGHEFEFGDEVFVPWSDGPYMYVKCGLMYNPRTERLVYVCKDQHLKWFGEKFAIV